MVLKGRKIPSKLPGGMSLLRPTIRFLQSFLDPRGVRRKLLRGGGFSVSTGGGLCLVRSLISAQTSFNRALYFISSVICGPSNNQTKPTQSKTPNPKWPRQHVPSPPNSAGASLGRPTKTPPTMYTVLLSSFESPRFVMRSIGRNGLRSPPRRKI